MSDNRGAVESPYRWVVMALAASGFTMAFVSRFAWPPLVPVVMPVMGITLTQAMAFMTAFYIGYVLTQIPGGVLADRFGPRRVLAGALALQALGTFAMGLTVDYRAGFILRIVCGLGAGCVYSSGLKAIVSWFAPAQRGLAIGVLMTSPTIGVAIPNLVMPMLETSLGWQGAFKVVGAAIGVLAVVMLLMMRDRRLAAAGPRKSFLVGLRFVLSNRNILLISLAGFSVVGCQIGFGSVGNSYLVGRFELTPAQAGRIMMVYGLVGLLMPSLAGYLCGKLPGRKRGLLIGAHVPLAALLLLFGRMGSVGPAFAAACGIGLLIAFANPISSVIIADNAGPEWAATAGGVGNCIFQIAAILSPLIIGMARDTAQSHAWT
ncbi:MAG: MFS transporter, partial [Deltaproteobacteria bacterium]|nr:MFS transporter [Deltaproteobacteria bacterium]